MTPVALESPGQPPAAGVARLPKPWYLRVRRSRASGPLSAVEAAFGRHVEPRHVPIIVPFLRLMLAIVIDSRDFRSCAKAHGRLRPAIPQFKRGPWVQDARSTRNGCAGS